MKIDKDIVTVSLVEKQEKNKLVILSNLETKIN